MKEGHWLWNVNFKPMNFTKWEPKYNEPNGKTTENCGMIFGEGSTLKGFWNDYKCLRAFLDFI